MAEHLYRWEFTDTFGGEANYCWVRRGIIRCEHRRSDGDQYSPEAWRKRRARVAKAARREAGLTGERSSRSDYGDMIRYDQGCTVLFVELGEFFESPDDPEPVDA
jgi:hypothetical protein